MPTVLRFPQQLWQREAEGEGTGCEGHEDGSRYSLCQPCLCHRAEGSERQRHWPTLDLLHFQPPRTRRAVKGIAAPTGVPEKRAKIGTNIEGLFGTHCVNLACGIELKGRKGNVKGRCRPCYTYHRYYDRKSEEPAERSSRRRM
jgi:hypothetical protein